MAPAPNEFPDLKLHHHLELEAGRALSFAKSQGKRHVCFYDEAMGQMIHRDRKLALRLEEAITNDELSLVFQPIVNISSSRILGAEALLRWEHPIFGAVSPETTVAIAQAEGLGVELSDYIIQKASLQAIGWRSDCFVSVNLHSADVQESNFSQRVINILRDVGLPPSRLWLEVTESAALQNSEIVQNNLTLLRAAGVRIAIDDFGVGYSSLSYLDLYPPDILKIDKSLVRNCYRNDSNRIIIGAINSLAVVNGFEVVSEGVEDAKELMFLRENGVFMVQGFGIYKPMASSGIRDLLQLQTTLPKRTEKLEEELENLQY